MNQDELRKLAEKEYPYPVYAQTKIIIQNEVSEVDRKRAAFIKGLEANSNYNEGLKELLRMDHCPEILIEYPGLIKSQPATPESIEWANECIARYKAVKDKFTVEFHDEKAYWDFKKWQSGLEWKGEQGKVVKEDYGLNELALVERYADNGAFSHYELIDLDTGKIVWPTESGLGYKEDSGQHGWWQVCPKCGGNGLLNPPYETRGTNIIMGVCDVCNGAKIIARPLPTTPARKEGEG